jgi:Gly-Xaa carboxypeptidase
MRVSSAVLSLLATATARSVQSSGQIPLDQHSSPSEDVCPLAAKVSPPADGLFSSVKFVKDPSIRSRQVNRLQKAVQVPSTSTELEDDPWSDYYAPFLDLHKVLEKLFPLV